MAIPAEMRTTFNNIVGQYGERIVSYQFSVTYTNPYDEESQTLSGSIMGSAFWLPVSEGRNGEDYKYIEQGLIRLDDVKLFYSSGTTLTPNDIVAIPSLAGSFSVVKIFNWTVNGNHIYNKAYLRRYTNG